MALADQEKEEFAQGLAYGFTPSQAAENARMDLSPIEAAHLSTDEEIVTRIRELLATSHFDPANEHIKVARQLEADRDFAYRTGNPAAAINATIQRAKVLGVFIERTIQDNNVAVSSPEKLTPEEWAAKFGHKEAE
jgi:ankyrin repeat protein